MRPSLLTLSVALLLTLAPAAHAVGTRTFELDTIDELSGGDLKGTTVDSLGRVRAGFDLGSLPLGEATSIWSALVEPGGAVLLGTGNAGYAARRDGSARRDVARDGFRQGGIRRDDPERSHLSHRRRQGDEVRRS